jgi:hypothetical protein
MTRTFTFQIPYKTEHRPHMVTYNYETHDPRGSLYIDKVTYRDTDVTHLIDDALYVDIWDAAIDDVIGYLRDAGKGYPIAQLYVPRAA